MIQKDTFNPPLQSVVNIKHWPTLTLGDITALGDRHDIRSYGHLNIEYRQKIIQVVEAFESL